MKRNIYNMHRDDRKFAKAMRRDALLIAIVFIMSFICFFLIPFVAYLGRKGGW